MKTKEYWQQVALLREEFAQANADLLIRRFEKLYQGAVKDIQQSIDRIFGNFVKLNALDERTAREYISKAQQDYSVSKLRKVLSETSNAEEQSDIIRRINAQAYGYRMTRLEAVKADIYATMKNIALQEQAESERHYQDVYADTYYQGIHDIGLGANSAIDFTVISPQQIRQAVNRPWYGKTFSQRVWHNTDVLAEKAAEVIQRGIATGASIPKMAKELESLSKQGLYAAVRLARTETNYICNQAQLDAYEDAGIEKYKFLATLDFRTCEICQPFDGKVFSLSEASPGNNYPTMHPNCRCTTTVPEAEGKRWANDGEHKYQVDGNITYKQWREQMTAEQRDAFDNHVRQWKNKAADKKQYERYKERLGEENMPKSFDLFQDLKYNDMEGWNKLMRNHKLFNKIDNTDSYSAEYKAKLKETYQFFKDNGYEFTEHGLGRMVGQRVGKSKRAFTKEDILSILKKPVNYIQEDGRVVKYYEQIAVIQATDTEEVISIVTMKEAKTTWREV